ncbi:MAG: T9SS type A sorting domain-containing protein, partial [Taibaiella sp.]|nr:T9SS type A sorting domain-containing protein [Taibaiella sp.]
ETANTYSLRWSGGKEISQAASKNGVIILLPEAMNPHGGPSVIAGHAIDSMTQNRLPDKVLFITDMNDVTIDHTFTDHNGNFSFTNLPFGTYKLFGDVWGKDNPDLVVTVDADHVNILNIIFTENSTEFRGAIAVSVADNSGLQNALTVYPNPVRDIVYISGAEKIDGDKQVTLTATSGAVMYRNSYSAGEKIAVPVQPLPQGIYILQLATGQGTATFRLVK